MNSERYDEIAETGDITMKSAVNVIYDMREDTFCEICILATDVHKHHREYRQTALLPQ